MMSCDRAMRLRPAGQEPQMHGTRIVAALLLATSMCAIAQEHQHESAEGLGKVQFATSCNQVAQPEFNRSVALLHSFQFSRAIEGFGAVLGKDPTCAIAYWGIALSEWGNPFAQGV